MKDLEADKVGTSAIMYEEGSSTFTYIIVDRTGAVAIECRVRA